MTTACNLLRNINNRMRNTRGKKQHPFQINRQHKVNNTNSIHPVQQFNFIDNENKVKKQQYLTSCVVSKSGGNMFNIKILKCLSTIQWKFNPCLTT